MSSPNKPTSPVWTKHMSTKRNQPYYYNIKTRESVWEKPEGCEIIDRTEQPTANQDSGHPSEDDSENDDLVKYIQNPEGVSNTVNLSERASRILQQMVEMKKKQLNLKTAKNQNKKGEENETQVYNRNELDVSLLTNKLEKIAKQQKDEEHKQNSLSEVGQPAATNEVVACSSRDNQTQDHLDGKNVNSHRKRKLSSSADSDPQVNMKKSYVENYQEQNSIPPIREPNASRVQNTTSEPTTSHNSFKDNYVPNKMFDLRSKLMKKKQKACINHTCTSEMEWEESRQCQSKEHSSDGAVSLGNKSPLSISPLPVPQYTRIYLVCDTCALVDDCNFLDILVARGLYLGIPTVVVIPFVVVGELDKLKTKTDVSQTARKINRILSCRKNNTSLLLQDANRSKEIVEFLEICNNDDLILNCCLQTKQMCTESEIAVLITSDNNLKIKAATFKQTAYDWDGFRQWARGYKEQQRRSLQLGVQEKKDTPVPQFEVPSNKNVYEDEKMDTDSVVNGFEPNRDLPTTNIKESCSLSTDNSDVPLLKNNVRSHLQELMVDLQGFLHAVLDEAMQNLYGKLKHHANNIKPSWTLMDYIVETNKRWSMISTCHNTPRIRDVFSKLIALVKKYRSAREDFTVVDVDRTFSLCQDVANLFAKEYVNSTDIFLRNLKNHREEWETDYKSNLSILSVDSSHEENDISIQPVDLALQNIHNCLRTDYEDWKERVESGNASDSDPLTLLYENIANFVVTLKRILGTENPKTFTITNDIVIRLHKAVACFSDAQGNRFGFDFTVENVVELLQDNSYRKNLEQLLDSFVKLEKQVDELLDIIDE